MVQGLNTISDSGFYRLAEFIKRNTGIFLNTSKKSLVINRLSKRMLKTGFGSIDEYLNFTFSSRGIGERNFIIDAMTTNKTYFYREPKHFEFISEYLAGYQNNKINIWSAGCSYGDEVYTLSMLLEEYIKSSRTLLSYSILGTDISLSVLKQAEARIYPAYRLTNLPLNYKKNFFATSSSDYQGNPQYKFKDISRGNVAFKKHNLIREIPSIQEVFDIIMCRNVLIYFTQEDKKRIVSELAEKLRPGGILMVGYCEGMLCRNKHLLQLQPSIFQKV